MTQQNLLNMLFMLYCLQNDDFTKFDYKFQRFAQMSFHAQDQHQHQHLKFLIWSKL